MVRSLSILGLINTIFLKNKWVKKEDIVFSITYVARLEIDKLDKTKSFIISLSYLLFKNSHPLFKCIFKINYVQPSSTLNFNKEPALWNGNIFILDSIFLLSWANKKGNRILNSVGSNLGKTQLMSLKFRNFGEFGWFCNSVFSWQGFEFPFWSLLCFGLIQH